MRRRPHHIHYAARHLVLLVVACLALGPATCAIAAESSTTDDIEREHLLAIESIEAEHGEVARELIPPLLALGYLYISSDRCPDAIAAFEHALKISRRLDGLFHYSQLDMLQSLRECYVVLDDVAAFERTQNHILRIHESEHGKDNPEILSALDDIARWYEHAGLYEHARGLYVRSMTLVRKAAGNDDIRLIGPLRGIARACRLESQFQQENVAVTALGERSLRRAATIARAHPEGSRTQRIETLLDLADWLQMVDATREAQRIYKEVWNELNAPLVVAVVGDRVSVTAGAVGTELLREPVALRYHTGIGVALRRPPPPPENQRYKHYTIDFEYTVTKNGYATDITILDTDAPRHLLRDLTDNLRQTKFRPRFENGEPADTRNLRYRQGIYVDE